MLAPHHHRAITAHFRHPRLLLLTLFVTAPTLADDYKQITDAAYCIGVVSKDVSIFKSEFNITLPGDDTKLLRYYTIVQGALKAGKVDSSSTNTLALLGQKDAQTCWDNFTRCANEGLARLQDKTADPELSKKTTDACIQLHEPICKRAKICNEP